MHRCFDRARPPNDTFLAIRVRATVQLSLTGTKDWPNKTLHRTLMNVAKIRDYNHVFRVAEDSAMVVERR